ncbi:MAG TPA: HXXEE domain-containing protein [Gemmatimonadaceae bacterium]|nr:HXXEE domain-containing protein [Gemmatimonadaceae bacterium]
MTPLLLWLPFLAIAAHLVEEFVWPGGFAEWYRHYPPGHTVQVSARLLVIVNVLFVALALVPPLLGANARGWAYWALVAAIAGVNGLFHIIATVRGRQYSPGLITGSLLYLPLGFIGIEELVRSGKVAAPVALQAIVIAVLYATWSSWKHRRSAMAASSGRSS